MKKTLLILSLLLTQAYVSASTLPTWVCMQDAANAFVIEAQIDNRYRVYEIQNFKMVKNSEVKIANIQISDSRETYPSEVSYTYFDYDGNLKAEVVLVGTGEEQKVFGVLYVDQTIKAELPCLNRNKQY